MALVTERNPMKIRFFQVDTFASLTFSGNPAGVCLLEEWVDDKVLQSIAAENNLSETAFVVEGDEFYDLRWFTPEIEVDLCGHATLASAHVIFNYVDDSFDRIRFESKSGLLAVVRREELLVMDFPSRKPTPCDISKQIVDGLGVEPTEVLRARDYLAVFDSEEQVRNIQPDLEALKKLDCLGIIVSAKGNKSDFVSRFFAPRAGIPEDPVTGSAHCTLIPYWSERLEKQDLHAFQVSRRGGELFCKNLGERVEIGGKAVTFLEGTITI